MTTVKCPNCKETLEVDKKYDDHLDDPTTCPHCNWTVKLFCFEFVGSDEE